MPQPVGGRHYAPGPIDDIAAVPAFSATSLTFISPLNFLWPTLVFVPLLIWLQRRCVPKTGVNRQLVAVAESE